MKQYQALSSTKQVVIDLTCKQVPKSANVVFGKISNENLEMVSEFFIKIKDYFEKVFVISHNPLINNWADTIIRIKKENNISKIN